MRPLLLPVYKLNQESTQPENMCNIVFGKVKGGGGSVHRMNDCAEAAVLRVLQKRCSEKFCKIHKKTPVLFLIISF